MEIIKRKATKAYYESSTMPVGACVEFGVKFVANLI